MTERKTKFYRIKCTVTGDVWSSEAGKSIFGSTLDAVSAFNGVGHGTFARQTRYKLYNFTIRSMPCGSH